MSYESGFADVYDKFTENTDISGRAEYICSLLSEFGIKNGILLDLACGTGSLSAELINRGYDLICVDSSFDMLSAAREKLAEFKDKALILEQDMRDLDLYGTIKACVCSLDSINHITEKEDVQTVFNKVSLFTEPGGVFIFDVNSVYKHREILGNNTFVYEDENDFLVWQNSYDESDNSVFMTLDIFSLHKTGKYIRYCDEITERAYETKDLIEMLKKAGFSEICIFGDMTREKPKETEERIYFAARK
ncbi:MAG: class I SAM-dependent methyltransferase [Oscillospiraceae bacterium]|nr:class I SAM-dependent methyltransferase [Oscillospiraceae bacterium]